MLCLRASDALSTPTPYCKSGNNAIVPAIPDLDKKRSCELRELYVFLRLQ